MATVGTKPTDVQRLERHIAVERRRDSGSHRNGVVRVFTEHPGHLRIPGNRRIE